MACDTLLMRRIGLPLLTLLTLHVSALPAQDTPPPHNLVIVLVDDFGWSDTSVSFHPAQEAIERPFRTPAIEALARRGAVFSDAHAASPVCSPSRAALLTGLHPARLGITDWIGHHGPSTQPPPGKGLLHRLGVPAWREAGLDPSTHRTLAAHLSASGHRTIHVGKWHLGLSGTPGADPLACGFHVNVGGTHLGSPGSHLPSRGYATRKGTRRVPDLEHHAKAGRDLASALTMEALAKIDEAGGTPFFLHLSFYAVHTPLEAMESELAAITTEGLSRQQRLYAAMVQRVDRALALLTKGLRDRDLLERTVICFTSDNGPLTAHSGPPTSAAPLKGGKGTAHEGGTRVPLIIAGPSIQPGLRSHLTRATDLAPTLTALLSTAKPLPSFETPDGQSLLPLLRDPSASLPEPPLLIHYPHSWWRTGGLYDVPGIEPFTAIREGSLRLTWFWNGPRLVLSDLSTDLSEQSDLGQSPNHRETRNRLLTAMTAELKRLGAQRPRDRSTNAPLPWPALIPKQR